MALWGYGLRTMTLEDPLTVGHAWCGNDIYSTQLLVWPGSATAVAILTPQQNDGDFTNEFELASALVGMANDVAGTDDHHAMAGSGGMGEDP